MYELVLEQCLNPSLNLFLFPYITLRSDRMLWMFDIAYQSKFCHELKYVTGQVILDFDVRISQVRHRLNGDVMIAKRYEEYSKC